MDLHTAQIRWIFDLASTVPQDTMPTTSCPKCSGEMARGFLTAAEGNGMYTLPECWVAGPPERSMWTGIKVKDKERHTLIAHRCRTCGFVEFYAPEQQS